MTNTDKITKIARSLRIAVVRQQYEMGNLSKAEAVKLLKAPLSPGHTETAIDDSELLTLPLDELLDSDLFA